MQLIYDSLLETATSTLRSIAKRQTRIIVLFMRHWKIVSGAVIRRKTVADIIPTLRTASVH